MSFHKKPLLILIFIALWGCKGLQYYQSGSNPANISLVMQAPSVIYTNISQTDSLSLFVVNNNSQPVTLYGLPGKLKIIGQSRFYKKEMEFILADNFISAVTTIVQPGDTVEVARIPHSALFSNAKNWVCKAQPSFAPHLINGKTFHPYIYLGGEIEVQVPNQENRIKIRTESKKIPVQEYNDPGLSSRKVTLTLTSDERIYNTETKSGNITCTIVNKGDYPIPLFNDPGSVRFKIYGYNPNRTSVMHTEYILDNGKLPVKPVNILTQASYSMMIPLSQLLFSDTPNDARFYWAWNKKNPPVSPLIYGKKDVAMDVEFWFGIVVDGKEYLSNTIYLTIDHSVKRKSKKNK